MMTRLDHESGTDRVAEVLESHSEFDLVINVQGDEPLIHADHLNAIIDLFENENVHIATLAQPIKNSNDSKDPNVVKLVKSRSNKVLYFSRASIPFVRDENIFHQAYKHLGVYAFRSATLLEIAGLSPSELEKLEKLEQLRWLQNGYDIHVALTHRDLHGVDVDSDLERVEEMLKKRWVK